MTIRNEHTLARSFTAWLTRLRQRVFGFKVWGNAFQRKGVPDYVLCVPYVVRAGDVGTVLGRFVGIELKWGRNKLSAVQESVRDEIMRAGGQYHLCYELAAAKAAVLELMT